MTERTDQRDAIAHALAALCATPSSDAAYAELCDLFDRQTNDGQDMSRYDALLAKALTDVAQNYRRRIARGLTSSRDFVIPTQSATPAEFELLTWLVIKEAP